MPPDELSAPEALHRPRTRLTASAPLTVGDWTWFVAGALVLAALVPAIASDWTFPATAPDLGAWALAIYAGTRLAWVVALGQPRFFALLFWLFGYVWLGIAVVAQVTSNTFPLGDTYSGGALLVAEAIVLAGFVAYDVAGAISHSRTDSQRHTFQVVRTITLFRTAGLACFGIASCVAVLLTKVGSLSVFFASRTELGATLGYTNAAADPAAPIYYAFLQGPVFLALIFFIRLQRPARSARYGDPSASP